jgi:hypothetical protein
MIAPILHTLLLCDFVATDKGTGKHTLVGVFENLLAAGFPARMDCNAFLQFSDGLGAFPVIIRVVRIADSVLVGEVTGNINTGNRAIMGTTTFGLSVIFQTPGAYELQVIGRDKGDVLKAVQIRVGHHGQG